MINHKKKRLIIVGSILPATNYSAYLIEALQKKFASEIETLVYTSLEKENKKTDLKNIKLVWSKNLAYPFQISRQVLKDKPQFIHLQHEFNMFGGFGTALIFPLLPFLLRMMGIKVVITIHAVVSPKQINNEFLETFWQNKNKFLLPLVRTFFYSLFKSLGWFSDKIIVHTPGLKHILIEDYHLKSDKVMVISHGVPDEIKFSKNEKIGKEIKKKINNKRFFLYYGYLHKRKKIELLLRAFQMVTKKYVHSLLVVAGSTLQKDYEEKLKKMVFELNLAKKVIFLGFVSEDDLRWLIDCSLFVLLPASYSIAASGPLAQMIAHHKPVIVSNIGVFKEEVRDNIDGFSAKNTPVDWASKIEQLLKDKKLSQRIVVNLKKKHQQRKWSIIAGETYNLYQTLI